MGDASKTETQATTIREAANIGNNWKEIIDNIVTIANKINSSSRKTQTSPIPILESTPTDTLQQLAHPTEKETIEVPMVESSSVTDVFTNNAPLQKALEDIFDFTDNKITINGATEDEQTAYDELVIETMTHVNAASKLTQQPISPDISLKIVIGSLNVITNRSTSEPNRTTMLENVKKLIDALEEKTPEDNGNNRDSIAKIIQKFIQEKNSPERRENVTGTE